MFMLFFSFSLWLWRFGIARAKKLELPHQTGFWHGDRSSKSQSHPDIAVWHCRNTHTHTLYIYIYMAVTSIGGHKNGQNVKNPQFYSQKWPTKTATKTWRFLLHFWFLLPKFLCLFLLVSPYFLLFHDILEPQNSPPNEVTGIYIYFIYVPTPRNFGPKYAFIWFLYACFMKDRGLLHLRG